MGREAADQHRGGRGTRPTSTTGRRRAPAAAVALLLAAIVAACSSAPQAVLSVPFSHTFGRRIVVTVDGPVSYPAGGRVAACVDETTALRITVDGWFDNDVAVEFDGVRQVAGVGQAPDAWISDPVGPGCGTISAFPIVASVSSPPDSLTLTVTKA